MTQLTIFDINKISQDKINSWKWQMLLKIHKAHNNNKISQNQYFELKERVEIYLDYDNDTWNLGDDENE